MPYMSQEKFASILLSGEMPGEFFKQYAQFRSVIRADHLILLRFSCGCWRFMFCKATMRGPLQREILGQMVPWGKVEHVWTYYFPTSQIECGNRVVDSAWLQQNLKVFPMRVPYAHHYFDHIFRENAKKQKILGDYERQHMILFDDVKT